jgi:hypothetical protein
MITIKNVRLSYPSLFKATSFSEDQEKKFSATFLIEKGSDTEKQIFDEIRRCAKNAFGDKAKSVVEKQDASQRQLLKDGDEKTDDSGDVANGYAGHVYLKATSKTAPLVIDRSRQKVTEDQNLIYGGCIVNAQIDIWSQKNKFGNFINCKLLAVQFWEDAPAFGNAGRPDLNAFDADDSPYASDNGDDSAW